MIILWLSLKVKSSNFLFQISYTSCSRSTVFLQPFYNCIAKKNVTSFNDSRHFNRFQYWGWEIKLLESLEEFHYIKAKISTATKVWQCFAVSHGTVQTKTLWTRGKYYRCDAWVRPTIPKRIWSGFHWRRGDRTAKKEDTRTQKR